MSEAKENQNQRGEDANHSHRKTYKEVAIEGTRRDNYQQEGRSETFGNLIHYKLTCKKT